MAAPLVMQVRTLSEICSICRDAVDGQIDDSTTSMNATGTTSIMSLLSAEEDICSCTNWKIATGILGGVSCVSGIIIAFVVVWRCLTDHDSCLGRKCRQRTGSDTNEASPSSESSFENRIRKCCDTCFTCYSNCCGHQTVHRPTDPGKDLGDSARPAAALGGPANTSSLGTGVSASEEPLLNSSNNSEGKTPPLDNKQFSPQLVVELSNVLYDGCGGNNDWRRMLTSVEQLRVSQMPAAYHVKEALRIWQQSGKTLHELGVRYSGVCSDVCEIIDDYLKNPDGAFLSTEPSRPDIPLNPNLPIAKNQSRTPDPIIEDSSDPGETVQHNPSPVEKKKIKYSSL